MGINTLRRPVAPHPDSEETRVLDFMDRVGRTGYRSRISALTARFHEIQAIDLQDKMLDGIDAQIRDEIDAAVERHRDWASDRDD